MLHKSCLGNYTKLQYAGGFNVVLGLVLKSIQTSAFNGTLFQYVDNRMAEVFMNLHFLWPYVAILDKRGNDVNHILLGQKALFVFVSCHNFF